MSDTQKPQNPFSIGCEAWRFSTEIPYPVPETEEEVQADYEYLLASFEWVKTLGDK